MANNINGASLNPIYQRLHDAPQYHPLEADTFADWSIEAGDIVTVTRDGKSYESPVHTSVMTWRKKQQVTLSSTGNEKRDSVSKMSQRKYNRGSSGVRNSKNMEPLLYEVFDSEGNMSRLNVTAAGLYHEVYDTDGRVSRLQNTVNGLYHEVYDSDGHVSRLQNTINGLYHEVYDSDGHLSRLQNTVNGLYHEVYDSDGSVSILKNTSDGFETRISKVVDDEGTIKTAEIVTSINDSESNIRLDADKVYIGNQKSTTVISGKLNANEFDAQHIAALLTNTSVLSTAYMFSTSMEIGTGTFTMDDFDCYIPDAFHALQIVQDGNTYKLQGKHFYSLDWADIGSFSRAVNSASWGWVSGYPKVTLSPQGQSFNGSGLTLDGITYSNKTWTQDKKKFSARFYVYDVSGNEPYGDELLIDTEDSWNAGWDGYYDSGYWASPLDNSGTCLRPKKDRTGSETWFTLDVDIPSNQIYTTDNNPRGTKLTTLRDRFIQAQQDSEYVCFRIDCGGVQKWYYMEP